MAGLPLAQVIDLGSIAVIILSCAGGSIYLASPAAMFEAFQLLFYSKANLKTDVRLLQDIIELNGRIAVGAGFVYTLIGLFGMLLNFDGAQPVSWAAVWRGIAVAIIPLIYGLALRYFVILPAATSLNRR